MGPRKFCRQDHGGYSLISALFIFALIALLSATFLAVTTQNYADATHQNTFMLADSLAQSGLQYGSSLVNNGQSVPSSATLFPVENNQALSFQLSQTGNTLTSTGIVKDNHGVVLSQVTKQEVLNGVEQTSSVNP